MPRPAPAEAPDRIEVFLHDDVDERCYFTRKHNVLPTAPYLPATPARLAAEQMLEALKAIRDAEAILTRRDRDQALVQAWKMADAAIAACEGGGQ